MSYRKATNDVSRFLSKILIGDGCWKWCGAKLLPGYGHKPYGRFTVGHRTVGAHRFSWELFHGPIPAGLAVCHRCDIPDCVNPSHLFLGTMAENIRDRDQKGRTAKGPTAWSVKHKGLFAGEKNGRAKLTVAAVQQIRAAYATGQWTYSRLGEAYSVSLSTIYDVVSRRRNGWQTA